MLRTTMAAKGLPRGCVSVDFKHHDRNSILNQEPRGGLPALAPATAASTAAAPAAGAPAAGPPLVSSSIIGRARGGAAPLHGADNYFASTIFLRLSKPALNTPSIVSVAVLSFSLSGGASLKFLRLNLADQVTNVLSAPSDVTTKVAE